MGGLFTQPWADAWRRQLEPGSPWAEAAADWRGSVGLRVRDAADGDPAGVFLDLEGGVCRALRLADELALTAADFVLTADERVWRGLLADGGDPLWALMRGQVKLERGSLARLAPHAAAARELLAAARRAEEVAGETETAPAPAVASVPEIPAPGRSGFQTTGPRGLDFDSFPMRLFAKSKRLGVWDPAALDFDPDRADWQRLEEMERDILLRLTSLFLAGEEAVTLDLLPLIRTIAREGRLEEELYLTSFLWEEAKHVEMFRRFLDRVPEADGDLTRYHTPGYRAIFYRELPEAMERLWNDPSPVAQAEAAVTYNMIVEGVLAETGYNAYRQALERRGLLPGIRRAVALLQADEARHIAFGVYLLSRLVAEHGDPVWRAIESRMRHLLPSALDVVRESFASYDPIPFGLEEEAFLSFAQDQFRRRFERVERARRQSLEQVLAVPDWELAGPRDAA